jgi:hypothetical protein
MGPGKCENVGKSQSVLMMINPIIFTHTRTANRPAQPIGPILSTGGRGVPRGGGGATAHRSCPTAGELDPGPARGEAQHPAPADALLLQRRQQREPPLPRAARQTGAVGVRRDQPFRRRLRQRPREGAAHLLELCQVPRAQARPTGPTRRQHCPARHARAGKACTCTSRCPGQQHRGRGVGAGVAGAHRPAATGPPARAAPAGCSSSPSPAPAAARQPSPRHRRAAAAAAEMARHPHAWTMAEAQPNPGRRRGVAPPPRPAQPAALRWWRGRRRSCEPRAGHSAAPAPALSAPRPGCRGSIGGRRTSCLPAPAGRASGLPGICRDPTTVQLLLGNSGRHRIAQLASRQPVAPASLLAAYYQRATTMLLAGLRK